MLEEYKHPGMKQSTIKLLLKRKIEDWLSTINPEIKELIANNIIITGGCIASMLLGEHVKDYDIYFKSKEATLKLAEYYVNFFNTHKGVLPTSASKPCNPAVRLITKKNSLNEEEERVEVHIQSAGIVGEDQETYHYFEAMSETEADNFAESIITNLKAKDSGKYRPIYMSQNAITLSDKIQFITRFYGTPHNIHRNFDYLHATAYYDYRENHLEVPIEVYNALASKSLIYCGSLYPIASIFRLRKFIERGWRITAGQLLKITFQISKLDLNNREVLQEQLIGVDQAYMHQIIEALKNTDLKLIDATYLAKIIDGVFE